jgi:hypothetical protein
VQVVLCLTALVGVLAVVLDGGLMLAERRRAQATADAAALAAAAQLFSTFMTNNGVDPGPSFPAHASATAAANANGYNANNSTITVNMNPASYQGGPNAGKQIPPGYAEVIVTYNQVRFFSSLWGSSNIPISARAVARGQWGPASPGLLTLNPTASGSLDASGNGTIVVTNAAIVVDSNSASAIVTSGSHATVSAPTPGQQILVTGNPGFSGSNITPTPIPGQPPMPDPLRFLPQPSQPANAPAPTSSNGVTTYSPGYYPTGLTLTGGYTAVFQPGIYYMNGTFRVNGNNSSSLTGSGVMIYIGANGSLDIGGNGNVSLSPETSGVYQGLTFFQDRTNTTTMQLAGNGNFNISGTFYAAKATAKVSGNGDSSVGSQFICDQLSNLGGGNSGGVNIVFNGSQVARTRLFNLVE